MKYNNISWYYNLQFTIYNKIEYFVCFKTWYKFLETLITVFQYLIMFSNLIQNYSYKTVIMTRVGFIF